MPDLPTVNTNYRSVETDDPGAALSFNRGGAQNVANAVPDPNAFSSQLVQMLQQYQKGFQNTANQATQQQALRTAGTSASLMGADPSLQRFARSASAQALEPTIGGARAAIGEAGEAIARLGQLKAEDEQRRMQSVAEAKQNIDLVLANGTSAEMLALVTSSPELFKQAKYDIPTIIALAKSKKVFEDQAAQMRDLEVQQLRAQIGSSNRANRPSGGGGSSSATGIADPAAAQTLAQKYPAIVGRMPDGRLFVDKGLYDAADVDTRTDVFNLANQAGSASIVSSDDAKLLKKSALLAKSVAGQFNLIYAKLPRDAAGRVTTGSGNKLQAYLQTDPTLATAFNNTTEQTLQLLGIITGSPSGKASPALLAEFKNNFIKKDDTVAVAQVKTMNIINTLKNVSDGILTNSPAATPAPATNALPQAGAKAGADPYAGYRAQLQPGEILVSGPSGKPQALPAAEFNAVKYKKL